MTEDKVSHKMSYWTTKLLYLLTLGTEDTIMIESAIQHWEELTCVSFQQLPTGTFDGEHAILFTNENDGLVPFVLEISY